MRSMKRLTTLLEQLVPPGDAERGHLKNVTGL